MRNRSIKLIASILIMASQSLANATAWPGFPAKPSSQYRTKIRNTMIYSLPMVRCLKAGVSLLMPPSLGSAMTLPMQLGWE